MAEYGRRRRALRRMWSLLSVAGTTVGVAAATTASVPGLVPNGSEGPAAAYRQGRTEGVEAEASLFTTLASAPGSVVVIPVEAVAEQPATASEAVAIAAPQTNATTAASAAVADAPPPSDSQASAAPAAAAATPWYDVLGDVALTRISYPWRDRLPGWTVEFLPGRPGLLGGTWTYEQRIEVYVRDGQSVDDVAFTLAHELGHAVDVGMLSEADRQRWVSSRRIDPSVPWWVESGATDFSSGSGDWAEAFAVWQVGGVSHSRVASAPSSADLALVAQLSRPFG
jgi:hypothetical protein